jgi:hypothetical protein
MSFKGDLKKIQRRAEAQVACGEAQGVLVVLSNRQETAAVQNSGYPVLLTIVGEFPFVPQEKGV